MDWRAGNHMGGSHWGALGNGVQNASELPTSCFSEQVQRKCNRGGWQATIHELDRLAGYSRKELDMT